MFKEYIEICKAVDRLSSGGIYLIDLAKDRFLFTSDYYLLRCGLNEDDMLHIGLSQYKDFLLENEATILEKMAKSLELAFKTVPIDQRDNLFSVLHFHVKTDSVPTMVMHKLSCLKIDNSGVPQLLLGFVTPSIHPTFGNIFVGLQGVDRIYQYDISAQSFSPIVIENLSDDECLMLRYSMQGFSESEISNRMYKSLDTIKYYRRRVFQKLKAHTIGDAVSRAYYYGLL